LPAASAGPAEPLLHDEYPVPLRWDQATENLAMTVKNPSARPVVVQGVQSTSGAWVIDYPKTIPAKGSAVVSVLVEARPGAQSAVEIVRLKTADGEKALWLNLQRPPLVTFDSARLQWPRGEAAAAKSVVLTLSNPQVALKSLRSIAGHTATFQKRSANSYLITVIPKSTASAATFPVLLTLDPAVPGFAPAITCVIAGAK
jgi:hypothetical protein